MLTRLTVRGFKNLVDVDVRFGPFSCIAGANGVGKSNLFDAIELLRHLADHPLIEAAARVRGGSEIQNLFTFGGDRRMSLAAEMLIPAQSVDDFGQRAQASATCVRYELEIKYRDPTDDALRGSLQIENEALSYVPKGEAKKSLGFAFTRDWFESVVGRPTRTTPFISTQRDKGIVRIHFDRKTETGDSKRGGRPPEFPLAHLPRTVLSSARNATESRTALLVRREMQSWRQLHLEPSALNLPDRFDAPARIGPTGKNLPSTLHRLAQENGSGKSGRGDVYTAIANRVAELVDDVRTIRVDRDDERKLLTVMLLDRHGVELPASALSDGTLRMLALAVLEQDPTEGGLICLEEPENGIHPERLEAMLSLIHDIAVDATSPIGPDNPLRQVIVNTHSPGLAGLVSAQDLLFAKLESSSGKLERTRGLTFSSMPDSWRSRSHPLRTISLGAVRSYLEGNRLRATQATPASGNSTDPSVANKVEQLLLFRDEA